MYTEDWSKKVKGFWKPASFPKNGIQVDCDIDWGPGLVHGRLGRGQI
jgi:hypothetical protein